MASRAKRKGKDPVANKNYKEQAVAIERERAIKRNRKLYAIVCGLLLLAVIIVMMPFNTAGIVNISVSGKMTFGISDSVNDYDVDVNVPLNAVEIIFGPVRTTKPMPYIAMKILDSINSDYDRDEVNNDPTLTLSSLGMAPTYDEMLNNAVAPIYALSCIIVLSLIALIVLIAVSMSGKCGMLPPLICAAIYVVLAIVQLGVGIYASNIAFPASDDFTIKLVTGAQTYVNFFFGGAICVATTVFGLKRRSINREYGITLRGGKSGEV
ncbi:MAG: hypothetical protein K2M44_02310 [Clostridia bacterium]|nr:hypothetical protein [Clostridia bacterium]